MDIVLDLETQESFDEIGGQRNAERLSVSVAGLYRYDTDELWVLDEDDLGSLSDLFQQADIRVIGYNITGFDLPVLKKYVGPSVERVATVDMMNDVADAIGRRLPLDALLGGTLDVQKSGHGLEAIEWWRAGEIEKLKEYCRDDVRLTRDLYEYGKQEGHVYYTSNVDGSRYRVPVPWGRKGAVDIDPVFEQAQQGRLCVAVTFDDDGESRDGTLEPRRVDETAVEGRLRETGEDVRIEKGAITRARLVMQQF